MAALPAPDEPGTAPMEARLATGLPEGSAWRYEPKWDGFRCLAYRDGAQVALRSKSGKPLDRFFPEVAAMIAGIPAKRFTLDGELLIATESRFSFAALQARLHPAARRIRRLAAETPARFMAFDCLALDAPLADRPFDERRAALEAFHHRHGAPGLHLSPLTHDRAVAEAWLARAGDALDGVVAKAGDLPYRPGERAMVKVKRQRTADCVVGGFRYAAGETKAVGSLLLGLYDEAGLLDHVGFTASFDAAEKVALLATLEPLIAPPGFTGNAPGGASRWATARSAEWQPLRPELVAEVRYDQVTGHRFRHGTTFLRWRPDKAPRQCGTEQIAHALDPAALDALIRV